MQEKDTAQNKEINVNELRNQLKNIEELPPRSYFLRLVTLLGTGTLFDAYDAAIIGSVIPALLVAFHLGFAEIGAVISITYVGQFFGAFIFGYISERYGRKPAYIAAVLEYSIFVILTGLSYNYGSLYAFRLLSGFGLGGEVPVAAALINEFSRTKKRGLIVLGYESMFAWGLFLAPVTAAFVYGIVGTDIGWRILFFLGVIPLVAGIISIFAVWESPRWLLNKGKLEKAQSIIHRLSSKSRQVAAVDSEVSSEIEHAEVAPKKTNFGELFSKQYRRRTGFIWVQWFGSYFVLYGLLTWLPTLFVSIGHLPVGTSLEATAILNVGSLALAYTLVFTIDRVGRKTWAAIGYCITIAGLVFGILATLVYHDSQWPVLLITSFFGFIGVGGIIALLLYTYTPELYPTRMRGWATSTGSSLLRIGTVISTYMVGAILAATSAHYIGLGYVFTIFAVVAAVSLIILLIFGIETKQQLLEKLST